MCMYVRVPVNRKCGAIRAGTAPARLYRKTYIYGNHELYKAYSSVTVMCEKICKSNQSVQCVIPLTVTWLAHICSLSVGE